MDNSNRDPGITESVNKTLAVLRRYYVENETYPTLREIAERRGMSASNIYLHIQRLKQHGLVFTSKTGFIIGISLGDDMEEELARKRIVKDVRRVVEMHRGLSSPNLHTRAGKAFALSTDNPFYCMEDGKEFVSGIEIGAEYPVPVSVSVSSLRDEIEFGDFVERVAGRIPDMILWWVATAAGLRPSDK